MRGVDGCNKEIGDDVEGRKDKESVGTMTVQAPSLATHIPR